MNHIWIIEMLDGEKWEPTTGCGLTKKEGTEKMVGWKHSNPHDKFRVWKYNQKIQAT